MAENNILKLKSGRILGYAEYGDPKGAPLFFFHGWPSSRLRAGYLHDTAKKLKIRLISPDRPGFGISGYYENRTLLDFPSDICELADHLEIKKFAVLGQSGGGPYAAVCAFKIPERLIKTGIVVGLAPTGIEGVMQGMSYFNAIFWKSYHKYPITLEVAVTLQFLQARNLFPKFPSLNFTSASDRKLFLEHKMESHFNRSRNEAFRQGKKGCALDLKLYTSDWGFDPKYIKGKVYLWYGDDDKNVSLKMGEYYHSQIKGSTLKVYPGEGHLILFSHTQEILAKLTK